jgi:hypothetical protein
MKHPSNRELFNYWNERRGDRLAPDRADIEPAAIRRALGDTFVLSVNGAENHLFRIAGTRLCALFGRELKAESFLKLWQRSGQTAIREMMAVVMEEKIGMIASVTGTTSDESLAPLNLEMMLLPLAYQSPGEARVMGGLAPMAAPYWLGVKTIGPLTLGMFRHIGAAIEHLPAPQLQAGMGRIRRGLTVYDGGRPD